MPAFLIARLAEQSGAVFADPAAWPAHLDALGLTALTALPDPVLIATEGAPWGSIAARGFLRDAVVPSDDAGQLAVGTHALCRARLPKVPRAPRAEWQARGMPSGWCISPKPSPISTMPRSNVCAA